MQKINRRKRSSIVAAVAFLSLFSHAVNAGPLVREVTSSDTPKSQVIVRDGWPDMSLILDREEYDPLDVTGVAVIRFTPGEKRLEDLRVGLQLRDSKDRPVLNEGLGSLKGAYLDVTLGLDSVPIGDYTLHAILTDRAGASLSQATAPLRKRVKRNQMLVPDRQQVSVRVWPAEGAMESDWPVRTGVPFPQGALFDQNHVRLMDENGSEVPCQTSVRSTWNRHGSVRWLGLDFIGRLAIPGARYTLEFGRKVQRAPAPQLMIVEDNAGAIRVNTGSLEFIVLKRGFNLIDEVILNGAVISKQDAKAGLELTDHEGSDYRASNDPGVQVIVEETGPVRTTIRATGWYVKDGTAGERLSPFLPTDRLCKHDTRITAFVGKPYLTVQHALIVTFDTHRCGCATSGSASAWKERRQAISGSTERPSPFPIFRRVGRSVCISRQAWTDRSSMVILRKRTSESSRKEIVGMDG